MLTLHPNQSAHSAKYPSPPSQRSMSFLQNLRHPADRQAQEDSDNRTAWRWSWVRFGRWLSLALFLWSLLSQSTAKIRMKPKHNDEIAILWTLRSNWGKGEKREQSRPLLETEQKTAETPGAMKLATIKLWTEQCKTQWLCLLICHEVRALFDAWWYDDPLSLSFWKSVNPVSPQINVLPPLSSPAIFAPSSRRSSKI